MCKKYCKTDGLSLQEHAASVHAENAARRRAESTYCLSWRGGGSSEIVGLEALAASLYLKATSIGVLFSRNGGRSFTIQRANPLTGELDACTVTKLLIDKPKRRRGRPPKHPKDYGTELA